MAGAHLLFLSRGYLGDIVRRRAWRGLEGSRHHWAAGVTRRLAAGERGVLSPAHTTSPAFVAADALAGYGVLRVPMSRSDSAPLGMMGRRHCRRFVGAPAKHVPAWLATATSGEHRPRV